MKLPFLKLSMQRLNPNHRYRLYIVGSNGQFYWLFSFRFSNKDKSVYIAPLLTHEYILKVLKGDAEGDYRFFPGEDNHLSLHESGVVNYKSPRADLRLRGIVDNRHPAQRIFTLAINRYNHLEAVAIEEISQRRGGHTYLPMIGISFQNPLFLTVYRVRTDAQWSPPALGNTFQLHYEMYLNDKDFVFHFLVWQDTRIDSQEGELTFSWA